MVVVIAIALLLFLVGLMINLLAPIIAAVIMLAVACALAIQAFYFLCGVYLLPAQIPLLIFTHWQSWWGATGIFAECYYSPLAWACSTMFYALCLFGPHLISEFSKGWRDAMAPPAPSGRKAVALMVAEGNARELAKLRQRTHTAAAPVVAAVSSPPLRQIDEAQRLQWQIDWLAYHLDRLAQQQCQPQTIIVQHVFPQPELEPESGLLVSIHGGLTSLVRGVAGGFAVSGGAVLGAGIITNRRRHQPD